MRFWSFGHSTHSLLELVALLRSHEVELVADIRTVPRSRSHPHTAAEVLTAELPRHGIGYRHLSRLGGWRRPRADSPNGAWRNASFRGYADYALTEEFALGLRELCALAVGRRTAMMCSEALWWRCHRRLVADRLVVRGDDVLHIGPDGRTSAHVLAPFAVPQPDGTLRYPPRDEVSPSSESA